MKMLYQAPTATRYTMQTEAPMMASSAPKINESGTLVGTMESRRYEAWDFTQPTYDLYEDN